MSNGAITSLLTDDGNDRRSRDWQLPRWLSVDAGRADHLELELLV